MTRREPARLTIRPALAEDATRLAALSADLGYPASPGVIDGRLARLLARADHCLRIAVSASGETIGWIHACEHCVLEADPWCEIVGLVVDPAHRGQGTGRALVNAIETWAGARGLRVVKVRSNVARAESHPFYQQLGYVRIKTQHVYRKPLP
jgi:GNAT superfamily N-acetyltransferase